MLQTLPPALNGEGNTEPVPPAFAYGAHSASQRYALWSISGVKCSIAFHGGKAREKEVLIGTTVQEKHIIFLADAKQYVCSF